MRNSISQPALFVGAMALTCFAGDPFAVPWYTIDGGGAMRSTSADERFVLSGTIGQHDAGVMHGGEFKLTGGFWFESPLGDCNSNGIVDLVDHQEFVDCMGGPDPGEEAIGDCRCFDMNGDELISLRDFAQIQNTLVTD